MIVYTPFWKTLSEKGMTTYTLRFKMGISGSTVQRLKKNQPLRTITLDDLCRLLNCQLSDVAMYVPDEEWNDEKEPAIQSGELTSPG